MPGVKFPILAEPVTLGALQLDTRVIMASLTRNRSIRKCLAPLSCYFRTKARHTLISHHDPQRGQRKILCSTCWFWSLRSYPL